MLTTNRTEIKERPAVVTKEIEQIKCLQLKQTNYVFFFGKPASGKTAITASLLYYLNSNCSFGEVTQIGDHQDRQLGETIKRAISAGRFPDRTGIGNVFEIDCQFAPARHRPDLKNLKFTFLDMGGEDLEEVSVINDGKFPSNIDIFFKAGNISMTFILVTPFDVDQNDDELMVDFLNYIYRKSPNLKKSRVLLLVSKWDQNKDYQSVSEFLQQRRPQTFQKLRGTGNSFGGFTLGTIVDEVDEIPYIQSYESDSAEDVFSWLYKALTDQKLR